MLEYIATDMAYLKYLWLGEVQHYDATKLGQGDSTKNLKRSKQVSVQEIRNSRQLVKRG